MSRRTWMEDITLYRFLAPKHDSVGIFAKKIKMAGILGWAKNPIFYLNNSKNEILQKVLPRFVVFFFVEDRFSKMADF
jgi:hypothetical protein